MASNLPLEKMSIEEKIQVMKAIWDDLCERADSLASPTWHGDVLAYRESARQGGDDEAIDWETTKQNIKNQL